MKKGFLKNSLLIMAAMLMLWSVVSCTNEDDKQTDGKATIQFKLTDAPALAYEAVNIDVRGISVGIADEFAEEDESDEDSSKVTWIELDVPNPGLYNLLDLRNGKTILLANGDIPAGKISQVRLLLGDESNVVIDGVSIYYKLRRPSQAVLNLIYTKHCSPIWRTALSSILMQPDRLSERVMELIA